MYSRVRNRRRAGNKRRALEKLAKRINVGPWINVGYEENVQIYITKNPSNLKISVDPGKKI